MANEKFPRVFLSFNFQELKIVDGQILALKGTIVPTKNLRYMRSQHSFEIFGFCSRYVRDGWKKSNMLQFKWIFFGKHFLSRLKWTEQTGLRIMKYLRPNILKRETSWMLFGVKRNLVLSSRAKLFCFYHPVKCCWFYKRWSVFSVDSF